MEDKQVMNAERVTCFSYEESYWNDLLTEEMDSLVGF